MHQPDNAKPPTHNAQPPTREVTIDEAFMIAHGHLAAGRIQQAAEILGAILKVAPRHAPAMHFLGVARLKSGDIGQAVDLVAQAVALMPDDPAAHFNLSCPLAEQGRWAEAVASARRAVELKGDFLEARSLLARGLVHLGADDEALGILKELVRTRPQDSSYWTRLGKSLVHLGRLDEIAAFAAQLAGARFPASAVAFERATRRTWANLPGRQWDGTNPQGRRLLICWEQGFGDVIMFVRFVPHLARRGASVILVCQRALSRLLSGVEGVGSIVEHAGELTLPPYDAYLPLVELPGALGIDISSAPPNEVPYVCAPKEESRVWRERLADDRNFHVGLVWSTVSTATTRRERSIPAGTMLDLLDVPRVSFYGLNVGARPEDLAIFGPRLKDLSPELNDFAQTAAVMKQMDLVITIDTAAAHLAGALGMPMWVLLPAGADWRWMNYRRDSTWYPTARLFRQILPGDWQPPLADVRRELTALAGARQND